MKEYIIPVNNEAHSRALVAIVGEDTAQLVLKAYKAIDSAMVFGYERGLKEAEAVSSEENVKEAYKSGYDQGHDAAFEEQETSTQESYDDGYVAGVSDARMCPADADREVARLCEADELREDVWGVDEPYDVFDEAYQGDSGDETNTTCCAD